jgi:hypothetical protein
MLRSVLLFILVLLLVRIVARVLAGVVAGYSQAAGGRRPGRTGGEGVHMVRDPVCGTFVVPDRALALADGSRQVFFCSPGCRDKYRARTA